MDELGLEVAKLHKAASFLPRGRKWPLFSGLDFVDLNRNFASRHNVVQVYHLLKTEEVFLINTQLRALLLKNSKHKTHVLEVLLNSPTVHTYVVKVDGNKIV
jgi:hypothetical protein